MTGTEKVGPVDHITRAVLPWRTAAEMTECGKPISGLVGRLVSRDEAEARIKRIGQQRAAFTLCMTCAGVSDRRNRFAPADAVAVVARETEALKYASQPYPAIPQYDNARNAERRRRADEQWLARQRMTAEFEAIAALIAAHREEFDGYLSGREQTVSLADRRRRAVVRRAGSPDYLGGA